MKRRLKINLEKNKKETREIKSKNYINFAFIFIIVLMIIISSVFMKLGLHFEQNIAPIYSYSAEKNADYEVLLKPNNFYTEETLPSGLYYASQSINLYKINFKYDFKSNEKEKIEYSYNVTAELIGTADTSDYEDKEIWKKIFIIKENNDNKIYDDKYSINENCNIDYEYYNKLKDSYEETYGIIIKTNLKVRFNISYKIGFSNLNVNNEEVNDYIELNIPITNTVTEAKENYEKVLSKEIIEKTNNEKIEKIVCFTIAGIFAISAIIVIIVRINSVRRLTPEEKYDLNINRILKYYKDLIVTVNNKPDISNLKVMYISVIDDLIDLAEQTQSNIIHFEASKHKINEFYIIIGEYVYIYMADLG